MFALALLLLAALAAQPQISSPGPTTTGWATLTISPALRRTTTTIVFGGAIDRSTHKVVPWVRRDAGATSSYADSRSCPGVARTIAALAALEPVRPRVPNSDADLEIVMDGVGYTLDVESSYGAATGTRLRISTNVGTPLADWAVLVERELEGCWQRQPPA